MESVWNTFLPTIWVYIGPHSYNDGFVVESCSNDKVFDIIRHCAGMTPLSLAKRCMEALHLDYQILIQGEIGGDMTAEVARKFLDIPPPCEIKFTSDDHNNEVEDMDPLARIVHFPEHIPSSLTRHMRF